MQRTLSGCRWLLLFGVMGMVAACASRPPAALPLDAPAVELSATPFFPQLDFQCGPAALATVLAASGVVVTPEALVLSVYLPGRKGSLQAELIAAPRAYERVAVVVAGELKQVIAALHDQRPVLVLLNLGVSWLPVWHYAVVIGYEPATADFILRSGREHRLRMPARDFARAWQRAENWGLVIATLDGIPDTASPERWLAAVAPLESLGRIALAERGYRAATSRWPESALAWTALGNAQAAQRQWREAVVAYTQALRREDSIIARNNRAEALGALQCVVLARRDLARASEIDAAGRYAAALSATGASLPGDDACPDALAALLQ